MNRKLILCLLLVALLTLAACATGEEPTPTRVPPTPTQEAAVETEEAVVDATEEADATEEGDTAATEEADADATVEVLATEADEDATEEATEVETEESDATDEVAMVATDAGATEEADATEEGGVGGRTVATQDATDEMDMDATEEAGMMATDEMDMDATEEPEMMATEEMDMDATEEAGMMATEEMDMDATEEAGMMATEEMDMDATEEAGMMATEDMDMDVTEEAGMMATEEMDMDVTEEPEMMATEEMDMDATEEPEMMATDEAGMGAGMVDLSGSIESVCLVTDTGRVNDGTFNQSAYNGMVRAAEEFGLDSTFIETQNQADYQTNIETCIADGYDAIITVGFLIADATAAAAEENPEVYFIGVDQFHANPLPNLVGLQFREDQAGFLAGAMAALVSESGTIAGVYGEEIPAVVKFRNGFEQGARYINPDIETLGLYIASFTAPAEGAEAADAFIGEGADVIFGAGGPTGSGGILRAAEQGVFVIGVDQDEFLTTFGNGETPGAEFIITSAIKRVDEGVYQMLNALSEGEYGFPTNSQYVLDAAVDGVGFAPSNLADVPEEVTEQVQGIFEQLKSGELQTCVDPVTGDLLEDCEVGESGAMGGMDMDATEEAEMDATEEGDDMDATEEAEMDATEEGDDMMATEEATARP